MSTEDSTSTVRVGGATTRDYPLLLGALTVSGLGSGLRPVTMSFVVIAFGGNAVDIGLVLAAAAIPSVVLGLLGGAWIDRLPSHRFLLMSDAGRAFCLGAQALMLMHGWGNIWALVLLNGAFGVFDAFFQPALFKTLPQTVEPDVLQRANSRIQAATTATFLIGLGAAGAVVQYVGVGAAVWFDASTYVVSYVIILFVRTGRRTSVAVSSPLIDDLKDGFRVIVERKWMLTEILRSAVEWPFAVAPFFILGPLIASERLDGGASWAAIVAAFTIGSLAGAAIAGRVRPRRPMLFCTVLMYLCVLPPLVLAFSNSTILIATIEGIRGAAVGFYGVIWWTLLQSKVPDEMRGRVSAWDYTLSQGFTPVGYLIAGPLSIWLGSSTTLVLGAGVVLVGVTVQLAVPSVRNLRMDESEVVG
jgi:MFS family permease